MQSESTGLRLHVLGEVTATYDGALLDLGGRRQRAVLAQLLIARGDVVPAEKIADGVWGEDLPGNVSGALQSYVSHWSAEVGGERHDGIVWAYETPISTAAEIAGLLSFYPDRTEIRVNGEILAA